MCAPGTPPIRRDPAVRVRWLRQIGTLRVIGGFLGLIGIVLLLQVVHDLGDAITGRHTALVGVAACSHSVSPQPRPGRSASPSGPRSGDTSVGGGSGGVELYDLASVHLERLPRGVPTNRSFVRGGHLLAFLALHELVSPWFAAEARESLGRLRRREITGPELYEEWSGVLASDMASDAGNQFLFHVLDFRNAHGSRYARLVEQSSAGAYGMPASWHAYDQLARASRKSCFAGAATGTCTACSGTSRRPRCSDRRESGEIDSGSQRRLIPAFARTASPMSESIWSDRCTSSGNLSSGTSASRSGTETIRLRKLAGTANSSLHVAQVLLEQEREALGAGSPLPGDDDLPEAAKES